MQNLMVQNKNQITSLELLEQINFFRNQEGNRAELQHKTLLEIIRDEFSEEIAEQKILLGSYKDKQNQERPMFELTPSQAKQVLVRESKFVRKAVIHYLEELENKLTTTVPQNFKEALRLAYEQQEAIEALQLETRVKDQQIAELQPKATYYDMVLQCKGLLSPSVIAKDYGKSAQWLNSKLHELGIQFKQGKVWLLYQNYADKGYTQTKMQPINRSTGPDTMPHTYWTQKGRLFIYELLKSNGFLPNIEKEYNKEA